mmetsp:Transcript_71116/g.122210  ORF Transcript_71116/g.122210 Transcript_71116/m.122210 type:complete len:254 (-) Transcript_71116:372-1133(-)
MHYFSERKGGQGGTEVGGNKTGMCGSKLEIELEVELKSWSLVISANFVGRIQEFLLFRIRRRSELHLLHLLLLFEHIFLDWSGLGFVLIKSCHDRREHRDAKFPSAVDGPFRPEHLHRRYRLRLANFSRRFRAPHDALLGDGRLGGGAHVCEHCFGGFHVLLDKRGAPVQLLVGGHVKGGGAVDDLDDFGVLEALHYDSFRLVDFRGDHGFHVVVSPEHVALGVDHLGLKRRFHVVNTRHGSLLCGIEVGFGA